MVIYISRPTIHNHATIYQHYLISTFEKLLLNKVRNMLFLNNNRIVKRINFYFPYNSFTYA